MAYFVMPHFVMPYFIMAYFVMPYFIMACFVIPYFRIHTFFHDAFYHAPHFFMAHIFRRFLEFFKKARIRIRLQFITNFSQVAACLKILNLPTVVDDAVSYLANLVTCRWFGRHKEI
jgi:hypothetical protein